MTNVKRVSDLPYFLTQPDNNAAMFVTHKHLTSLEGCPKKILGSFHAEDNELKSLVGGPKVVGGHYIAADNLLTSLMGMPSTIGRYLDLDNNLLTSLSGINALTEMHGLIYVDRCPIESHILGVFFIKGCTGICTSSGGPFGEAVSILNQHIDKGRAGLLPCQKELIEAGLVDFAQI
jgi:hypothetical protein